MEDPATEVESVKSLKTPSFWQNDPKLWFAQLEAQFHNNNIRSDVSKYYTIIAALDCSVLQQVSDLIANPPRTGMYEKLKQELISAFTDSKEKQLKRLLTEMELGDQRPSQLLRAMRTLAGQQVTEDVLKTLWMQRLPNHVQIILSASQGVTPDKMAEIADKIIEVSNNGYGIASVSAASTTPPKQSPTLNPTLTSVPTTRAEISELQSQISALTKLVEDLRTDRSRPCKRCRSHSRTRERSQSSSANGVCFYHRRFGQKARKCTKPCTFEAPEN